MGEVVAVLGGGQLGRMLGLAGVPLGLSFRFLDPSPEAPAQALGPLVVGALGDEAALRDVARGATAVTYEWEGVPAEGARALEQLGYAVRPGPNALEVAPSVACREHGAERDGRDGPGRPLGGGRVGQ